MAEEARLESVYTPKGYPEFESRSLRKNCIEVLFRASIQFYIESPEVRTSRVVIALALCSAKNLGHSAEVTLIINAIVSVFCLC